jgi:HlyD family secretion protein
MMKKIISVSTALILLCTLSGCGKSKPADTAPAASPSERRPVSYSGVMTPVNETKIYCGGKGEIIQCDYAVGDRVNAGALLYKLDDNGLYDNIRTTENSIKKADLSINTADENLSNLRIYAPSSGILHNFDIKTGERVNTGTIGQVVNEKIFTVKIPFNEAQIEKIAVGDSAVITSGDFMTEVPVTVSAVYDAKISSAGGSAMREVEFNGQNSGGFCEGLTVDARVETACGTVYSPLSGTVSSADSLPVVSRQSGNAKRVYFKEGQAVKKGDLLLEIENSNINSTAQRAKIDKQDLEIKLASLKRDAKDLTVYAPSSGIITEMSKSLHDSVSSSGSSLMTISDTSSLTMEISVSNDDIDCFSAGDSVDVDCDGAIVTANIESISEADNSVRLSIPNPDGAILPGTVGTVIMQQTY